MSVCSCVAQEQLKSPLHRLVGLQEVDMGVLCMLSVVGCVLLESSGAGAPRLRDLSSFLPLADPLSVLGA